MKLIKIHGLLREIYFKLVPYLSIKDTEVHHINSKEVIELTDKIEILENQNQQQNINHQREMDEKDKEIAELKAQLKQTNETVKETKETLDLITKEKTYNSIYKSINNYVMDNFLYDNPKEEELVVLLATDYAVSHKDQFDYSGDYIKKIIRRVDLQIEMDGRLIDDQLNSYFSIYNNSVGAELQLKIQDVLTKIWSSKTMMKKFFHSEDSINHEDLVKLEDLIENELSKYGDELSDEDINNIILDVAMQY